MAGGIIIVNGRKCGVLFSDSVALLIINLGDVLALIAALHPGELWGESFGLIRGTPLNSMDTRAALLPGLCSP